MPKAMIIDDSKGIRTIMSRTRVEARDMPLMRGLELVRRLRSHARHSPVLLMRVATETDAEQVAQAMDAEANEYVMKPFTMATITDKLRLPGAWR